MGRGVGRSITLDELIARQRFMLNRTTRVQRLPAGEERPGADVGKKWAEFEKASAEGTHALTEVLEKLCGRPCPMLYDAEKEMLAAADVLPGRKFAEAVPHDRGALSNLVKARDTVRLALPKLKPGSDAAQMQQFERMQFQKLRHPKEEDEKQEAEQLGERLRQLAKQEEFIYATIAAQCEEETPAAKVRAKSPVGNPAQAQAKEPRKEAKEQPETKGTAVASPGSASGQPPLAGKPSPDAEPAKLGDLQKRQEEIAREAAAVQQSLSKIARSRGSQDFSELAQERIDAAVKKAEETSGALDRGDKPAAAATSREATGMFTQLAIQLEGLLAREAAQQVAAARDLASQLAQREHDLADRLGEGPEPKGTPRASATGRREARTTKSEGGQTEEPSKGSSGGAAAVEEARQQAEGGRTLEDVLRALARSGDRNSPEVIAQIEKLLREGDVPATVGRLEQVVATLRSGRWSEGRTETRQLVDRLEMLAQRLDDLHRMILAPRVQALVELEKRAAALRQNLTQLESQVAVADWHRQTDVFLQELTKRVTSSAAAARLQEAMRDQGWGGVLRPWDRGPNGPYYSGPGAYVAAIDTIVVQLQQEVRELVLKDLVSVSDEATPPQYKELVERYFQVLSQRGPGGSEKPNPKPVP